MIKITLTDTQMKDIKQEVFNQATTNELFIALITKLGLNGNVDMIQLLMQNKDQITKQN